MEEPKYLGRTVRHPIDELDVFDKPEGVAEVAMTSDEVGGLCPVTGQPDFYTVTIRYEPDRLCIESKSLKLYLWGFRERPAFGERMAARILERVVADVRPKACEVTVRQKARGGVAIETRAVHPAPAGG